MNDDVDPKRILIVRLSHLGDVVCALPVYHALRQRFPKARFAWAIQPEFADLVRNLPGVDICPLFSRRDGAKAWWSLRRELRDWRADWAIDCQGNAKSAAVTRLSGAARRIGLHRSDWREPLARWVLTDAAPACSEVLGSQPEIHAVQRMLVLAQYAAGDLGAAGIKNAALNGRFDLALNSNEEQLGGELCDEWLPDPTSIGDEPTPRRPLIVQIKADSGANADPRAWPASRWRELLTELDAQQQPCLILSGPAESALGRQLANEFPTNPLRRHWVGQRGLRDLAAFLWAAGQRGALFLGTDSGPQHLAWASGLPVIALAGPQSHLRTGPWPPPEHVSQPSRPASNDLEASSGPSEDSPHAILRALEQPDCAPCLARSCHHPDGPICMQRIEPAQVLQACGGFGEESEP